MVKQTWKTSDVKRLIVQGVVMGQDVTALTNIYDNIDEYAMDTQVDEVAGRDLAKLESIMRMSRQPEPAEGPYYKEWRAFVSYG
jgi:hypothetical protein